MTKVFPIVKKVFLVAGDGAADFLWTEDAQVNDTAAAIVANPENAEVDDTLGVAVANPENVQTDDKVRLRERTAEDVQTDDRFSPIAGFAEDATVDDRFDLVPVVLPEDVQVNDPWRAVTRGRWNEDANVDDLMALIHQFPEGVETADFPVVIPQFPEGVNTDDLLSIRPNLNEDSNVNDLSRWLFDNMTFGRSGTPDSDASGDGWVDKASQATNHGNEALSINGEVLNTERRGLLFFDFTRFANTSVRTGGTHSFKLFAQHDAATGANNLRVRFSTLAAKPFVESTVTWDTPLADGGGPAEGTLRVNTTVAVAAGAAAQYTIALTDQNITDMLGQWVYVRLLSEATLAATRFTVQSREAATVSQRPTFQLQLQRGT